MKVSLGIDFGTSYSNCSIVTNGSVECITDSIDKYGTPNPGIPTAVSKDGNGNWHYGVSARTMNTLAPDYIKNIKTAMRHIEHDISNYCGTGKSLYQIIKDYLHHLIKIALQKIFRDNNQLGYVTIGCPVKSFETYRSIIERMVIEILQEEKISLSNSCISVQPESSLAALDYIHANPKHISANAHIAVFDMGGGTTDFSIVEKDHSNNLTIADFKESKGLDIGGFDIDKAFLEYILCQNSCSLDRKTTFAEWDIIEEDKIAFSNDQLQEIVPLLPGKNGSCFRDLSFALTYKINKDTFFAIPKIDHIIEIVSDEFVNFLENYVKTNGRKIDHIIMTGGSSQINQIKDRIENKLREKGLNISIHRSSECIATAISNGAALYGGKFFKTQYSNLNHAYGTDCRLRGTNEIGVDTIISKSDYRIYPFLGSERYSINSETPKFTLEVYEYDSSDKFLNMNEVERLSQNGDLKLLNDYSFFVGVDSPRKYIVSYVLDEDTSFLDIYVFEDETSERKCVQVIKHTENITSQLIQEGKLEYITYNNLSQTIQNKTYKSFLETLPTTHSTRTETIKPAPIAIVERVFPENLLDLCGHNEANLKCIDTAVEVKEKYGKFNIYQVGLNAYYAVELKGNKPNPNSTAFKVKKAMFGLSNKWKKI